MQTIESPLGLVRHELAQHTGRLPLDDVALVHTMHAALATFGEAAAPLAAGIIKSLDSQTPGGLGVRNAVLIEQLGDIVTDTTAERVAQSGALSLLGALAITHDPELHNTYGTEATDTPEAHAAYRAQVTSTIARHALDNIINGNAAAEFKAAAAALLAHTNIPPEDLAIEFELNGFRQDASQLDTPPVPQRTETPEATDTTDESSETVPGVTVSEQLNFALLTLSEQAQATIRKMDWLNDNLNLSDITGRNVYHDGKRVAAIFDFTPGNAFLRKQMQELTDNGDIDMFWDQLGGAVAKTAISGTGKRPPVEKVPTFCMANKATKNVNIVRGYYVPIGTGPTGERYFALVAAFRTKGPQAKVLKMLAGKRRLHRIAES